MKGSLEEHLAILQAALDRGTWRTDDDELYHIYNEIDDWSMLYGDDDPIIVAFKNKRIYAELFRHLRNRKNHFMFHQFVFYFLETKSLRPAYQVNNQVKKHG